VLRVWFRLINGIWQADRFTFAKRISKRASSSLVRNISRLCSLAVLVAPADKRAVVVRYAAPAIVGTVAASAAMNGFAFASYLSLS